MYGVHAIGAVKDEDVKDAEPGAGYGPGGAVVVGNIPCLAEAGEAGECDDVGCYVVGEVGGEVGHEWVGESVGDGFVLNMFSPLGEGAFLTRGEEELEPALGGEVLEGDGVEGTVGWYWANWMMAISI